MLKTPLGEVKIYLDDKEIHFIYREIKSQKFPNVTTYHIEYEYVSDNQAHNLKCSLENCEVIGYGESGEDVETICFETDTVRLSIGTDGEFRYGLTKDGLLEPSYLKENCYDGIILENGLEITIPQNTSSRKYQFRVASALGYTKDTAHHTWLMADPNYNE